MTVSIEVPGHYGRIHIGALEMKLRVTSRLSAWRNAGLGSGEARLSGRLDVMQWAELLDSIAATLTSPEVVGPLADLAGVDPITVRQPRALHITSVPFMPGLLPAQLSPIRDAGESRGTAMLADPALDMSDPVDRAEQVDLWLNQMAADAGLLGMEQLVAEMRRTVLPQET